MENIAVSIVCNAYNHEKYIRDALEGFVMQKTNFEYEILVHDDASTDNTADIIREYEEKYPHLIRAIYQTENQWSKRSGIVGKLQYGRAKGEFIALCEGDDYWTSPYKLQKQYDALKAHPGADFCAHKAIAVDAVSGKLVKYISPCEADALLTVEQIIEGGGEYVATNSIMFRKSINEKYPRFREAFRYDYALQIHAGLRGGMVYLADCMSAYRVMSPNSWSHYTYSDSDRLIKHIEKVIDFLDILNEETEYRYDKAVKNARLQNEFRLLKAQGRFKELKNGRYRKIYLKCGFVEKCYFNASIRCLWLIELRHRIKKR